jgi:hypothetical protein
LKQRSALPFGELAQRRWVRWRQRGDQVDTRCVRGILLPDAGADARASVAAGRAVALVPEARQQPRPCRGNPLDAPTRLCRLVTEAVSGKHGHTRWKASAGAPAWATGSLKGPSTWRPSASARVVSFESPDVDPADQDAVIDVLARWIRRAIRTGPAVIGAVIALPGLVRGDGFVYSAPYLGWESIAMRSVLWARTRRKIPIEVGNDANFAALGEHRHGAGAGSTTLLVLLAEEIRVGGGLVHDGALFTGSAGYGFEAGHLQVNPGARRCACGARGCRQVLCDSGALVRAVRRRPTRANPAVDAAAVLAAAATGDLPRGR